jgi:hypothetical protein
VVAIALAAHCKQRKAVENYVLIMVRRSTSNLPLWA